MTSEKIGCGVLAVVGIVVGAVVAYWSISPSYDQKTAELARHMATMSDEHWGEIYRESESIFLSTTKAERSSGKALLDSDLPRLMRGLGFDRCFVRGNGVFYERIGGGWHLNGTWVHSIHLPGTDQYDRRGIWFDGFKRDGWVYESTE